MAIPDHLSYEEASTLPCAALTAWNALIVKARLKAGDTVLVLGTDGASIFALLLGVLNGARVFVAPRRKVGSNIGKRSNSHPNQHLKSPVIHSQTCIGPQAY